MDNFSGFVHCKKNDFDHISLCRIFLLSNVSVLLVSVEQEDGMVACWSIYKLLIKVPIRSIRISLKKHSIEIFLYGFSGFESELFTSPINFQNFQNELQIGKLQTEVYFQGL